MNAHQYWALCNHLEIIEGKSSRAAWKICERSWQEKNSESRFSTFASFKASRSRYNKNSRLLSSVMGDGSVLLSEADFNRLVQEVHCLLKKEIRNGG